MYLRANDGGGDGVGMRYSEEAGTESDWLPEGVWVFGKTGIGTCKFVMGGMWFLGGPSLF